MSIEDDAKALAELTAPRQRPTTRRERIMVRKVEDVRTLDVNDVVTFYTADNQLRYYVRLTKPTEKRGVAVFHLNRKGRPSYKRIPSYVIPPNIECALVYRRELSAQIEEHLFRKGHK